MSRFKIFLRASNSLDTTSAHADVQDNNEDRYGDRQKSLTGDEVSAIYEKIVGLDAGTSPIEEDIHRCSQKEDVISRTSLKPEKEFITLCSSKAEIKRERPQTSCLKGKTTEQYKRLQNDFLKYAQDGDLDEMIKIWAYDINIDYTDAYGWTALMCASREGHKDVVRWLLENNADVECVNNQQKTAKDIAKNRKISRLIEKSMKGLPLEDKVDSDKSKELKTFYCEICKEEFSDSSQFVHETSTLHLFNNQEKITSTHYFIPPANRGFQMMLRSGWEPEKGLGNEGQGRKFPIKTVLKRDREGLGGEKPKEPKITHFAAKDEKAIKYPQKERKMRIKTLKKKERAKQISKEKAKEINFRREFS